MPGATTQDDNNAPLMVAFADLKWTKLHERPGMMLAVLSGDRTKGEYTQMRKVPAGSANPLHFAQQPAQERDHQWRQHGHHGRRFGQGLRPRFNRCHARELEARERLSRRKRLCVLPGRQR